MNTNVAGFKGVSKGFATLPLDERGLSIGVVNPYAAGG